VINMAVSPVSVIGVGLAGGAMINAFDPIKTLISQELFKRMPVYIPEYPELFKMYHEGYIKEQDLKNFVARKGIATPGKPIYYDFYSILKEVHRPKAPYSTLVDLRRLGILDEEQYRILMKGLGYNNIEAEYLYLATRKPLQLESIIYLFRLGKLSESEAKSYLKKLGFELNEQNYLLNEMWNVINVADTIALYRRGIISEAECKRILRANGYKEEDFQNLLRATEFLPGPSDIIRFAVREVYSPEIVEKYRMAEDYPERFTQEAKKLGIPEEYAKQYWLAHWDLPSVGQAIELFRRIIPVDEGAEQPLDIVIDGKRYGRVISEETLKTLMRTLDIMPYWRDKLLQLAYEIPTRIDVRRMYRLGIINRDYVKKLYMEIGYREEDAEALTEYTILDAVEEEKELTKNQILELFEIKAISEEDTIKYLMELNYSKETAEYIITLKKYEIAKKEEKEYIDALIILYSNGQITHEKLQDELNKLNLPPAQIIKILDRAEDERNKNIKLPSKEDILKWYRSGYITKDKCIEYLRRINIPDEFIPLYMR